MNILKLKINSAHLSSAKLICPNSCVLVLSFFILNINFTKAFFKDFLKGFSSDSPNLTQKV